MNDIQKIKIIYKKIDEKPCKITQLSNGKFEVKVDLENQNPIYIFGKENKWRLSQYTDTQENEFYAIDYKKENNKEQVAYANDKVVGYYKNVNELDTYNNVIKEDINFLKKLNNEIEEYKENELAKYKMCGE